ncbi:acyltransferase family protein [Polymorphospora rubra]|uniref:acyltransferase family protein n=1 Tax=Polymorphospora rubra TaxID=338584 RepID=UPI001BB391A1|nr:acyltransferase family protein [Polymorphospora rubra]
MAGLRQLAAHTPASRDRYVDTLRALAITLVVLGHWLVTVIAHTPQGRLTGHSALPDLRWAWPLTWLVQVLPVFFLVGGYANAASLTAHRDRGGSTVTWLLDRGRRLLLPTTVLLVTLALAALVARVAGADPKLVRDAVWYAAIPLWFLSPYLLVVLLTRPMYALHRRYGVAVPLALAGLVALGDLARFGGHGGLAVGSFLFGWLAVHQVGFAWRDVCAGRPGWPARPRVAVLLLVGGLTATILLTWPGPYPVSMINIPGERLHNMSPPSLALLTLATAQIGLILLLRPRTSRLSAILQLSPPFARNGGRQVQDRGDGRGDGQGERATVGWTVVVAINAFVLTVFLWHVTAVLLLAGLLDALGVLPTPPVGTLTWWLWRVPWLLMLIVLLAGLVAVFGRVETRAAHRLRNAVPDRRRGRAAARSALTVAGFAAATAGLVGINAAPRAGEHLLGMPAWALASFLVGVAALEVARATTTRARPDQVDR